MVEFILRFVLFACAHSLFAVGRVKRALTRFAGGELRHYRLLYNAVSLILFGWVMGAYTKSPTLYAAPETWKWLLYAAQLTVALIILRCVFQTGAGDFLGFSQFRSEAASPRSLVTNGCYSRVRHPLYLYSTLFLLLNPVMTVKWLLLTVISVTYFIIGAVIEERRLLDEFGDEYRTYKKRVPFLIPDVKSFWCSSP